MKKEQIGADFSAAYSECKQTIRPMGNLMNVLSKMVIDLQACVFLFNSDGAANFKRYVNSNGNILKFYEGLNPKERARLNNYIESMTPSYEVEKNVSKVHLDRLLESDPNMLPTLLRDINYANYSGTLDENAILRWVVDKKKMI